MHAGTLMQLSFLNEDLHCLDRDSSSQEIKPWMWEMIRWAKQSELSTSRLRHSKCLGSLARWGVEASLETCFPSAAVDCLFRRSPHSWGVLRSIVCSSLQNPFITKAASELTLLFFYYVLMWPNKQMQSEMSFFLFFFLIKKIQREKGKHVYDEYVNTNSKVDANICKYLQRASKSLGTDAQMFWRLRIPSNNMWKQRM